MVGKYDTRASPPCLPPPLQQLIEGRVVGCWAGCLNRLHSKWLVGARNSLRVGCLHAESVVGTIGSHLTMLEVDFDVNVTDLYDAIGKSDWSAASEACRNNPIEAETWVVRRGVDEEDDEDASAANSVLWRFLPLHSACARRPPSNVVRSLLQAYPEAASFKDESGMYPLHYACGNRASRSVIAQLIECFPRAVRESDPQGMLPLHYTAQWGPSEDSVVELLLDEYTAGVSALNGDGMSPLDLCREGNFDGWQNVLMTMKRAQKGGSGRMDSSVDSGSYAGRSARASSRNGRERDVDLFVASTIEVPRSSPRSSSRGRARSSSRSRARRSSSRSHREPLMSTTMETKSPRSSSRSRRTEDCSSPLSRGERSSSRITERSSSRPRSDARDELPTPRRQMVESRVSPRSLRSVSVRGDYSFGGKPQSISCSLASPRYHDMKTPRSSGSGRGPAGFFGQKTPRSSGRSVEFDFEDTKSQEDGRRMSPPPPSPSVSHVNRLPPIRMQDSRTAPAKHRGTKQGESDYLVKHEQSRLQQENAELQKENAELHARNTELRAKLAEYSGGGGIAELRAKLAQVNEENRQLKEKLEHFDAMQEEVTKLRDIHNEIIQRKNEHENVQLQASAERRRMLLELLAVEEQQEQLEHSEYMNMETLRETFNQSMKTAEQLMRGGSGEAERVDVGRFEP